MIPNKRCPCCGKYPMEKTLEMEDCPKCKKRHATITYHCNFCHELIFAKGEEIDKEKVLFT